MSEYNGIQYWGITLGSFPILAVIVTKQPAVIGDVLAEYDRPDKFEANAEKGIPASTHVAFGLLGVRIPLKN